MLVFFHSQENTPFWCKKYEQSEESHPADQAIALSALRGRNQNAISVQFKRIVCMKEGRRETTMIRWNLFRICLQPHNGRGASLRNFFGARIFLVSHVELIKLIDERPYFFRPLLKIHDEFVFPVTIRTIPSPRKCDRFQSGLIFLKKSAKLAQTLEEEKLKDGTGEVADKKGEGMEGKGDKKNMSKKKDKETEREEAHFSNFIHSRQWSYKKWMKNIKDYRSVEVKLEEREFKNLRILPIQTVFSSCLSLHTQNFKRQL